MQQHIGGLLKRTTNGCIAGATDSAGPIHLTGLIAPGREAEVRAHRSGISEPSRLIYRAHICQGHQRPDPRYSHQSSASSTRLGATSDNSIEFRDLLLDLRGDYGERL